MRKILALLGLGLFVAGYVCHAAQDRTFRVTATPQDTKVGTAWFRLSMHDGQPYAEPLTAPIFQLRALNPDFSGAVPEQLSKCAVMDRLVGIGEKESAIFNITVLKCSREEFAVGQVIFQQESK